MWQLHILGKYPYKQYLFYLNFHIVVKHESLRVIILNLSVKCVLVPSKIIQFKVVLFNNKWRMNDDHLFQVKEKKRNTTLRHAKTSMLWPSQNFLLCKSTLLMKYFTSMFLRLHAIEDEIRLSRVFRKKKNNRKSY